MILARHNSHRTREAFTLIELIGVLAIMAILAAAVAPNAVRSLDRTAVRAEADTLHQYGEILKQYVCDTNNVPTATTWVNALLPYASSNAIDLQYNKRQPTGGANAIPRRFAYDATNQRAMFISSMRSGTALPSDANIATYFNTIWNWDSANIDPNNVAPAVLAAWVPSLREFLVIERVNLKSIQSLTFTLRNQSATIRPIYRVFNAAGTQLQNNTVPLKVGTVDGQTLLNCRPTQRITLCDQNNNILLSFAVGSQARNFVYDGATWSLLP
jgi:prepilin-type N-terminal cleavage/methylation domain-containing protein